MCAWAGRKTHFSFLQGKFLFVFVSFFSLAYSSVSIAVELTDLQKGDLIFSVNPSLSVSDHVAVFSGFREDGKAYVTHATGRPHDAIVTTLLRPEDGVHYVAFRNKNFLLALSAYHRMMVWATVMVPYDRDAAEKMMALEDSRPFCHPTTGVEKQYQLARELSQPQFYRRIKYAARRNRPTLPADPRFQSRGRGFRCAEAVSLAFQIEEIVDAVADLSDRDAQLREIWVSDKYANPEIVRELHPTPQYLSYLESLIRGSTHEFDGNSVQIRVSPVNETHPLYFPSIVAWNAEVFGPVEEYARDLDTCIPLDSKVTSAHVLYYHVQQDSSHWESLGELEVPSVDLTPEARARWRSQIAARRQAAVEASRVAAEQIQLRTLTDPERHFVLRREWDVRVQNLISGFRSRSPQERRERATSIYGTPPRLARTRSSDSTEPCRPVGRLIRSVELPSDILAVLGGGAGEGLGSAAGGAGLAELPPGGGGSRSGPESAHLGDGSSVSP